MKPESTGLSEPFLSDISGFDKFDTESKDKYRKISSVN